MSWFLCKNNVILKAGILLPNCYIGGPGGIWCQSLLICGDWGDDSRLWRYRRAVWLQLTSSWWEELIIVGIELDNLITLLSHFCGVYVVLANIICTSHIPSSISSRVIFDLLSIIFALWCFPPFAASFLWLLTQDFILTQIRFFVYETKYATSKSIYYWSNVTKKVQVVICTGASVNIKE